MESEDDGGGMQGPTDLRLFTIGYQLRSADEVVSELVEAGVDVLIDVRETPWSYRPDFRAPSLRHRLIDAGIRYVHAKFAGNPKELRRSAATHEECLDSYALHVENTPDVISALQELLHDLWREGSRPCLMCYERHPADCHRSVLVELWSEATGTTPTLVHLEPEGAPRFTERA